MLTAAVKTYMDPKDLKKMTEKNTPNSQNEKIEGDSIKKENLNSSGSNIETKELPFSSIPDSQIKNSDNAEKQESDENTKKSALESKDEKYEEDLPQSKTNKAQNFMTPEKLKSMFHKESSKLAQTEDPKEDISQENPKKD